MCQATLFLTFQSDADFFKFTFIKKEKTKSICIVSGVRSRNLEFNMSNQLLYLPLLLWIVKVVNNYAS